MFNIIIAFLTGAFVGHLITSDYDFKRYGEEIDDMIKYIDELMKKRIDSDRD